MTICIVQENRPACNDRRLAKNALQFVFHHKKLFIKGEDRINIIAVAIVTAAGHYLKRPCNIFHRVSF
ncbi:MAG: hypothetical protein ABIX01_01125 [Chitinophagaceae bacterium]